MGRLVNLYRKITAPFGKKDAFWTEIQIFSPSQDGKRTLEQPTDVKALMRMYREWVYTASTLNAMGVASTPLRLYVAKRDGAKLLFPTRAITKERKAVLSARQGLQRWMADDPDVEQVLEHPFYDLWERGNASLTGTQLKSTIDLQMELTGDSFCLLELDGTMPFQLIPLAPHTMRIEVDTSTHAIVGYIQKVGSHEQRFAPEQIVHFKFADPGNMYYGFAPLEAIALTADLYHSMNVYEAALMKNDAVPGLMVVAKEGMGKAARKRTEKEINQAHKGRHKAGKTLVFSAADLTVEKLGLSQKEMSFAEGRRMARQEIAAAFQVPDALMSPESANLAISRDAREHHARYAILPRTQVIEEQVNRDIIPLYGGDTSIFAAFDNPVPAAREFDLERAKVMVTTDGIFMINEGRKATGEDALEEFDGQLIEKAPPPSPFGMRPGMPPPGQEEEPEEDEDAEGEASTSAIASKFHHTHSAGCACQKQTVLPGTPEIRRIRGLQAALRELFARQAAAVLKPLRAQLRAYKAVLPTDEPFDFDFWVTEFAAGTRAFIEDGIVEGGIEGVARLGVDAVSFDINRPEVARFIDEFTFKFSEAVNGETQEVLRDIFRTAANEGSTIREITDQVQDVFQFSEKFRAERIARSEAMRSVQAGQVQAWKDSGVVEGYFWDPAGDACEFCLAMGEKFGEGAIMTRIGDTFQDQGSTVVGIEGGALGMNYSDIPHPPLHPNCLVGETPIVAPDEMGGLRAHYTGSIIDIELSLGQKISATPGHLFLTPDGLVRAGDLSTDSSVIYCNTFERKRRGTIKTAVGNLIGGYSSCPATPHSLHGDGSGVSGNIEVAMRNEPLHNLEPRIADILHVLGDARRPGTDIVDSDALDKVRGVLNSMISSQPVIGIGRRDFDGMVYDLQTKSSLYLANGVVSSNCRCDLQPVVIF